MHQAILLVGHGTRNETGQRQFLRLAEHLRSAVAPTPLAVAYIELQSPTIEEALVQLHAQGLTNVTLSPALLFAAGHAKQDIPVAVAAALSRCPGLEVKIAEPLGCHEAVLELAALRANSSLAPVLRGEGTPSSSLSSVLRGEGRGEGPAAPIDSTTTTLVLIGRGSSDPTAIAHCHDFTTRLATHLGCSQYFTGFIAIAKPSLPEVLLQAATSGARTIIVQPHLLFSGEMLDSTAAAVAQARESSSHLEWRQSDCLGADLERPQSIAAVLLAQALRSNAAHLPE